MVITNKKIHNNRKWKLKRKKQRSNDFVNDFRLDLDEQHPMIW